MNRFAAVLFTAVAMAITAPASAQVLDLTWHTFNGGGGASVGGSFNVSGTIGQADAGTLSGGPYEIAGGFWPGISAQPLCEADTNNSGAVDVDDLVAVILAWGNCPGCPPNHCPADVAPFPNGDCAINADDLVSVILHWGSCP